MVTVMVTVMVTGDGLGHGHESQSGSWVMSHSHESQSWVTVMSHSHESQSWVTVMSHSHESQSWVTVMSHRLCMYMLSCLLRNIILHSACYLTGWYLCSHWTSCSNIGAIIIAHACTYSCSCACVRVHACVINTRLSEAIKSMHAPTAITTKPSNSLINACVVSLSGLCWFWPAKSAEEGRKAPCMDGPRTRAPWLEEAFAPVCPPCWRGCRSCSVGVEVDGCDSIAGDDAGCWGGCEGDARFWRNGSDGVDEVKMAGEEDANDERACCVKDVRGMRWDARRAPLPVFVVNFVLWRYVVNGRVVFVFVFVGGRPVRGMLYACVGTREWQRCLYLWFCMCVWLVCVCLWMYVWRYYSMYVCVCGSYVSACECMYGVIIACMYVLWCHVSMCYDVCMCMCYHVCIHWLNC
jgi:hypothetical protein